MKSKAKNYVFLACFLLLHIYLTIWLFYKSLELATLDLNDWFSILQNISLLYFAIAITVYLTVGPIFTYKNQLLNLMLLEVLFMICAASYVDHGPHAAKFSPLAVGSEEKLVIVTGSTSGIGFHTSKKIA